MRIQLVVVAVLVGAALGGRHDSGSRDRDPWGQQRPRGTPLPAALVYWSRLSSWQNVNAVVTLDSTVYATSYGPVLAQLQSLLPQAGVQLTSAADGQQIAVTNVAVGDVVQFLRNAKNETTSVVVIMDQTTVAGLPGPRAASEFTVQLSEVGGSQRTLAAKMGNSNLKPLLKGIAQQLAERAEDVVRGILTPLLNAT